MFDKKYMNPKDALSPELLKERAVAYAKQEEEIEILGALKQFLCFRLGQEWFLVEIGFVSEVVPHARISRIPGARKLLSGMMNLRGGIVLIADLARLLRLPPAAVQEGSKIIVVKTGENLTGFSVDEAQEAIQLDTGRAQSSIATLKGIEAEFIKGLFQYGGKHLVWLDIERVLDEIEK